MGCLLLICFYYLSREAAAVSVEMNQKQVIVVDCGHGGMDPGMIGIDGLKEKDVNLAIGLKVKSALEKKDFQVVMNPGKQTWDYTMKTLIIRKYKICKKGFFLFRK